MGDRTRRYAGVGDPGVREPGARVGGGGGATFTDVVKLNYYVVDISQIAAVREARDRHINVATPPASTLVEVRRLFRDDLLLEVDAVAVVRHR
jgi:enamine deaminase RidA (YjgF/YER057c/UK114 family)